MKLFYDVELRGTTYICHSENNWWYVPLSDPPKNIQRYFKDKEGWEPTDRHIERVALAALHQMLSWED